MTAAAWIAFWWGMFAGTHMVLSSLPARARLIDRLGEKGFVGLYSLIAFATFVPLVWVYLGNRHAGSLVWNLAAAPGVRPLSMLLAVLGIAAVVGGVLHPSPALVGIKQAWGARGLTRITRHPLFMGIALWALSHLLLNGFVTDVVFFGGAVSERTLTAAWDLFAEAEALLVVGSSLAVYSGFRFVRRAQEAALPVAVVNVGPTRADDIAAVKVSAPAGAVLPRLAASLGVRS